MEKFKEIIGAWCCEWFHAIRFQFRFYYIKLNFILFFVKGEMLVYKWVDNVWASQKGACALISDIFHPPIDSSIRWESVHGAALYASLLIAHTKESKENSRGIDLKTCFIPYTIFPFDTSFLMVHTKQVSHLLLSIHMPHWSINYSILWLTLFIVCCRTSFL